MKVTLNSEPSDPLCTAAELPVGTLFVMSERSSAVHMKIEVDGDMRVLTFDRRPWVRSSSVDAIDVYRVLTSAEAVELRNDD